jgi:hypothetical protein
MLLAAATDNRIPNDPVYVRRVGYLNTDPDFAPLLRVQFLEYVTDDGTVLAGASAVQASATECSSEERRVETEGEERSALARASKPLAKGRKPTPEPSPSDASVALDTPGLNLGAWTRWTAYRRDIRKPLKPASLALAARQLAEHGDDQLAVVEQSIANGWQGLFALKLPTGAPANGTRPTSAYDRSIAHLDDLIATAEARERESGAVLEADGGAVRPALDQRARHGAE